MKNCPYCYEEIKDEAIKCKHCGEMLNGQTRTSSNRLEKELTRSSTDKMFTGVCGGLGEYLDMDPTLVRLLFVIVTLFSGGVLGIIAYIVMAVILPEK